MTNYELLAACLALLLPTATAARAAEAVATPTPPPAAVSKPTPLAGVVDADAPGCAVERLREACMVDSGKGTDMRRCLDPAIEGANAELRRVLQQIKPMVSDDPPALDALAAAQMAWQGWIQRDCESVAADWQGGAMQSPVASACLYEHTLGRAQTLWRRHVRGYEGRIPEDCLPGR